MQAAPCPHLLFDAIAANREPIMAALEHANGTHNFDDIALGILAGRFRLWQGNGGCLVTEFEEYPRKRVLNVFLGGGKMPALIGLIPSLEAFAKDTGCQSITVRGRKGWSRALEAHGLTYNHAYHEKVIQ